MRTARDTCSPKQSLSGSRTRAIVATSVAVSNARTNTGQNAVFQGFLGARKDDQSMPLTEVPQTDSGPRRGQETGSGLRPFHECDRVVEVALEVAPLRGGHAFETVEIEVRDRNAAAVDVADRVARARHGALDTKGAAGAPNEGRLATPELPGNGDDVSDVELGGERRGDSLGLLRGRRFHLDHTPSLEGAGGRRPR